jgi:predicted tellurium resistance membrane protein TerC
MIITIFNLALANLLLSSDNILMIALFGQNITRKRRLFVLLWSMIASVLLSLVFLFIVSFLFRISFLQSLFGLVICYMAFHLLSTKDRGDTDKAKANIIETPNVVSTVWKIVMANLMMSFENIATLIGLSRGNVWIAWLAILVTSPLVFFGSHLLARLLTTYDFIVDIGAVILFKIGLDLIFTISFLQVYAHNVPWILTGFFAVYVIAKYLEQNNIFFHFRNRV